MKKGDERRKLILNTAEELFCTRGFDDTSVNDVLEITNLSKGGFYHYFDSKDALLLAVCESHVAQSYERCIKELESTPSSAERLESVLKCAMLLRNEDWPFMRVMLPRVRLAGDATLASLMRCIMVIYSELLQKEIERAEAKRDILTPVSGHAHQLIALVLLCLNQIAEDVLSGNGESMLRHLTAMRRTAEVLLDLPYGSMEIYSLEHLLSLSTDYPHEETDDVAKVTQEENE